MTKEQYEIIACYLKALACVNAPNSLDDTIAKALVAVHAGPHKQMAIDDLPAIKQLAINLSSFHIQPYIPFLINLMINDYQRASNN